MTDLLDTRAVSIPVPDPDAPAPEPDEVVLSARQRITLRCGRASITLHPDGSIVLRGEYILSDAEAVNRISGGRVELN